MRPTTILLATAAAVYAQNSVIEEYGQRYDFWLNPPSRCSNTGCSATKCGSGQCQFGVSCGTWAGKANSCCEVRHAGKTSDCAEFKDVLEDFSFTSDGDAAILTEPGMQTCGENEAFLLSNQQDRTRSYCCPFGQDGVVSVDYGEFLNNLTIVGVRCIPRVKVETGDTPSTGTPTTTGGTGSPASTSSGSTASSSPNAANTLKNVFALVPIALMALTAL
ncbi:hypothetical protein TWF718_008314 [Orbilia javanica]|uniref:Uncharacterized protein n=1 Tax=Orbilia javanica TaxID=47235 RepID=A0AAN8MQ42_9PEZI